MLRRLRLRLRRVSDPDQVGRLLRLLFTKRVLEGDREPGFVAAAYEWAYEEVQRRMPHAASAVSSERVSRMTDENLGFAVAMSLQGLDVQHPAVIEHERDVRAVAGERVTAAFGAPLDELCVLRAVAHESCERFHAAGDDGSRRHEALARLTARGMLIADEIQHLLQGGYPSSALARWRSLHEASVIAAVLAGSDEATARRYLDHEAVGRAKAVNDYQRHAPAFGETPLDQQTLEEIIDRRDALVAEHGTSYKRDFGWAAHLLPDPNFRTLEALAERDWMRPYYGLANHPVHAGSGNLLNEIGVDDNRTLLTGPSAAGLTDPIQLTAHSLVFLIRQLLYSGLDDDALQWIIQVEALERLSTRTIEALKPEAHEPRPEAESASSHRTGSAEVEPLPSLLAWPDISWAEVRAGVPRA